jgi:tRNA1Val (adenine37-N6)-methyltransferase
MFLFMPNNYFQFKQFKIYQDKCSMKVCTDACIFGAWVAKTVAGAQSADDSCSIANGQLPIASCLDIGTGTGLLTLMIAQKSNVFIDAIEIETGAYDQAKENFRNSPWNERVHIIHSDAKEFMAEKRYDLIISNPPFFENDLLSMEEHKNIAKHNTGLGLVTLLAVIKKNISDTGHCAILLPYARTEYFEKLAYQNEFHLQEQLLLKQTPTHNFFRSISLFGQKRIKPSISELTIKNTEGMYDPAFKTLLQDYYLHL